MSVDDVLVQYVGEPGDLSHAIYRRMVTQTEGLIRCSI